MKEILKEIVECQERIYTLERKLDNKSYWINKAKEEAGFEPHEGDWISIDIKLWKIEVNVYPKSGVKGARYWINGKWFNTSFPEKIPYNTDLLSK